MRTSIVVGSLVLALAACGDDTGGSTSAGGGQGGGSTTAASAGGSTSDGGAGPGSTTTATTATTTSTGTGGGDFQSVVEACEDLDAAYEPFADELGCTFNPTDCQGLPSQFPGCEDEAGVWLACAAAEARVDDCACDGTGQLTCTSPEACSAEYDAFTSCAF